MKNTIIATNETLKKIIKQEIEKYGAKADLNHIDVSRVTDMSCMFYDLHFKGDISKWDVSNVTNMKYMFFGSDFDRDISKWDISNVTIFDGYDYTNILRMKGIGRMLRDSLSRADLSKCDIGRMFRDSLFGGDISKCDTSNVTDMRNMCIQALFKENK